MNIWSELVSSDLSLKLYDMNGGGRYRRLHHNSRLQNPQRPYAKHPHTVMRVKIWSDLHGDMQSQAEMSWPLI